MSFALRVITTLNTAIKNGHIGIFCTHDISLSLGESANENFRKRLSKGVAAGWLLRLTRDMCSVPDNEPAEIGVLEYIASKHH